MSFLGAVISREGEAQVLHEQLAWRRPRPHRALHDAGPQGLSSLEGAGCFNDGKRLSISPSARSFPWCQPRLQGEVLVRQSQGGGHWGSVLSQG